MSHADLSRALRARPRASTDGSTTSGSGALAQAQERPRAVSFAPPGKLVVFHNIPLSADRRRALFFQSNVIQTLRETLVRLPVEVVAVVLRALANDETLDVKNASGVELWAYTMSRERQPHSPAQAVWDAAMHKMEDEYVKDDFRFACALLNTLTQVELDYRAWRCGALDPGEQSDQAHMELRQLRELATANDQSPDHREA